MIQLFEVLNSLLTTLELLMIQPTADEQISQDLAAADYFSLFVKQSVSASW